MKSKYTITPGSEQVRYTIERDGFIDVFNKIGGSVFANACGPCIGQWARKDADKQPKNTIVHSFNRNFSKRADGNPNTYAFVGSPELVTALTLSGNLTFNPITDYLINEDGEKVLLSPPEGFELPPNGFGVEDLGFQEPSNDGSDIEVIINKDSDRLQKLEPFEKWDENDTMKLDLLIKVSGKCTTDHISMAGPWLKFRGHLDNISNNLLIGATNSFNNTVNFIKNKLTNQYDEIPKVARDYRKNKIYSIIIGEENYGEGSSREHAAMEPRHMGVKAVLVRLQAQSSTVPTLVELTQASGLNTHYTMLTQVSNQASSLTGWMTCDDSGDFDIVRAGWVGGVDYQAYLDLYSSDSGNNDTG